MTDSSTSQNVHAFRQAVNDLRMSGQLFDGTIILKENNQRIRVHRIIISAASSFLQVCFGYSQSKLLQNRKADQDDQDHDDDHTEIEIDVPARLMTLIIDYIYTGTCTMITVDNVQDLLGAADYLLINGLVELCCKFMKAHIEVDNVIGIYLYAKHLNCTQLQTDAHNFIVTNIERLAIENDELLELAGHQLLGILSNKYLNVQCELKLCALIKKWTEHVVPMQEERTHFLPSLMKTILFDTIDDPSDRANFLEWAINVNDQCRDVWNQKNVEWNSRVPTQVIMVIGGWSNSAAINHIELYDTRAKVWIEMQKVNTKTTFHSACVLNGKIYVFGGFNHSMNTYNLFCCYDPALCRWKRKARMFFRRAYTAIVTCNNMIYVIGGFFNYRRYDLMEKYDPLRNQWYLMKRMKKVRSSGAAVVFDNQIIMTGGSNGLQILSCCEIYNIETKQWSVGPSMNSRRCGHCLVVYRNNIYAIGGDSGFERLKTVEKYVPGNNYWLPMADMQFARSNLAAVVCENKIYAIGGYNQQHVYSHVECYDPENDVWSNAPHLNVPRSGHSASVLENLPHLINYSVHAAAPDRPNPAMVRYFQN